VSKAGVPYTTNNIAYNAGTMSGMYLVFLFSSRTSHSIGLAIGQSVPGFG
jgi:hypothetical protein